MAYSSDIEILDVEGVSNSSDDDDNLIPCGKKKTVKKNRSIVEKRRRNELTKCFEELQQVITNGDPEAQTWSRSKTVSVALKLCQDLAAEENNLRYESEVLFQEYWLLKRRFDKMIRRKNRKSRHSRTTNTASSLSLSATGEKVIPEKSRVPTDASPLKGDFSERTADVIPDITMTNENKNDNHEVCSNPPRRRIKEFPPGISEEEKEFYMLNEKINALMIEVDALWDEVVKDEEEEGDFDSDDDICVSGNEKKKSISEEKRPTVSPSKAKPSVMTPSISATSDIQERPKRITVTDIRKLLEPKFLQNEKFLTSTTGPKPSSSHINTSANNLSGDESPRLVIDEGESPRNSDQDIDAIEESQAVGTLCQNLVDVPSTSECYSIHGNKSFLSMKEKENSVRVYDDSQGDTVIVID